MSYWVIDANIAVNTVTAISDSLRRFWNKVDQEQISPCAPRLWMSETTSAIRFSVYQSAITLEQAEDILRAIHRLRVEIMDENEDLSLRALELAEKLGQSKAYDAFYLALAEQLVVDFWTADERLYNRCGDLKLGWVHWIEEL